MRWFWQQLTPAEIAERDAKARARVAEEAARAKQAHEQQQRLETAVGIGVATLVAHSDTWTAVKRRASQYLSWPHAEVPVTKKPNGMVEVSLSGQHVMTLLWAMQLLIKEGRSPLDRALGRRIYTELARTVDAVDTVSGPGKPVPPIVLDARLADSAS